MLASIWTAVILVAQTRAAKPRYWSTRSACIPHAVDTRKVLTGVIVSFHCTTIKPTSNAESLKMFGASRTKVDQEAVQGEAVGEDEFVLAVQNIDTLLVDLLAHSKERRDKSGRLFVLTSNIVVYRKCA